MSARNQLRGVVSEIAEPGALTRVVIDVQGVPLIASLTTQSAMEMELGKGLEVYATFKTMAVHLCQDVVEAVPVAQSPRTTQAGFFLLVRAFCRIIIRFPPAALGAS